MLAAVGIFSAVAPTAREWVTTQRPWALRRNCDHRRPNLQLAARSGRRGTGDLHDPWREEERRQALLKYVQEVQPQSVTQFADQTPPVVVQAMRQTVLNVVGSLPPQYFDVRISTVAESLAQLMLSIMTTGYMLRSAQFRLELQNSLQQLPRQPAAIPAATSRVPATTSTAAGMAAPTVAAFSSADYGAGPNGAAGLGDDPAGGMVGPGAAFLYDGDASPYAPGVQKKNVEGEVLRWHLARGEVERLAAADYIELLEREVAALRAQVAPPPPSSRSTATTSAAGAQWRSSSVPPQPPLDTSGAVEVLGPDPFTPPSAAGPAPPGQGQGLACVSPLPGFGERAGAGLSYGGSSGLAAAPASAAAPATMGCGGIPLVVGSPLGLPRNELLDYLHGLQANGSGGFKELACSPTTASGQAVKEAMELFVARLMGTTDPEALAKMNSEFTSVELSKVLFWLMAVGYTLKNIESRLELDDGMGGSSSGGGGGNPQRPSGSGGGDGSNRSGGGNGGAGGKRDRKGGFAGLRGLLPGF